MKEKRDTEVYTCVARSIELNFVNNVVVIYCKSGGETMEIFRIRDPVRINSGKNEGQTGVITDIKEYESQVKNSDTAIMEVTREYLVELDGSHEEKWFLKSMLDKAE